MMIFWNSIFAKNTDKINSSKWRWIFNLWMRSKEQQKNIGIVTCVRRNAGGSKAIENKWKMKAGKITETNNDFFRVKM